MLEKAKSIFGAEIEKNMLAMLNALCIHYTAAFCCDLRTDHMENIKKKEFSHTAITKSNYRSIQSYREWIDYTYNNIIIKESAPDYLKIFDAQNLMQRLTKQESFVYRHKTLPNSAGMEYFELVVVRLSVDENSFKIILGYRPIDDLVREEIENHKKMEHALKLAENANEAKTNFLRHLSHDIRTPINGILGMIEMAEHYKHNPAKVNECHQKMRGAIEYLTSLVSNVLDLGKLESGKIVLEHEPFNLGALLLKHLVIVETLAKENGISLHGGKAMSVLRHRKLIGSPTHLIRVLMNLANNAIKYNHTGGAITLYCTEVSSDENTAVYEFVCSDTGLGMSKDFQKHAFEPFTQEGKEALSTYTGSGLGLSIVKKIVEQMHGTIALDSVEGQGTTFIVTIPFEIDKRPALLEVTKPLAIDLHGRHALLVEDNKLNREIAKMLLEDEGLIITTAENGLEALNTFKSNEAGHFSFIFMDIMMPVMDGLEATHQIRASQKSDAKTIPIIAMSANAFKDDIKKSLAAGMTAYLTKPLDITKLKQTLYATALK